MALKSVCIFWSLRSCLGMAERWLYYGEFSPRFNEMYTGALFEYYRGILWEVNIQLSGINDTRTQTRGVLDRFLMLCTVFFSVHLSYMFLE